MGLVPVSSLWGGTAAPACLLDAFPQALRDYPDRTAVVTEEVTLSYLELMDWARAIAAILTEHRVAAGEPVAIACPRGAPAVAAMVAVTLYGACYVPLDREYPVARLRHMLDDSCARVVLWSGAPVDFTDTAISIEVPKWTGEPCGGNRTHSWLTDHDPDLPVYVIYTSGSTGWPKGVALQHSVLDNVARWQAAFSPAPDLRTAQFAPLNFDVSFQEIFGTLVGGGTLVVVPERMRREPGELIGWLAEHRVQRLFLPYVALQMLAVAASFGEPVDHLELVEINVAGEQAVCTDDIRALFAAMPGCRLVNHYGQSESAMVTAHVLGPEPAEWPTLVPIGSPLPGCELLLGDVGDPDECVGELLVAGLPVALGYLGMPELNLRRYQDIAETRHGNKRVFRTGDLVRFESGVVRYLSRLDDDVKVRGVRVDLAEIDARLMALPGVTAGVAVLTGAVAGPKALRAGVVLADSAAPFDEEAALRALGKILPEVSVPASLTVLDSVPRAPSGKIDRIEVGKLVQMEVT